MKRTVCQTKRERGGEDKKTVFVPLNPRFDNGMSFNVEPD